MQFPQKCHPQPRKYQEHTKLPILRKGESFNALHPLPSTARMVNIPYSRQILPSSRFLLRRTSLLFFVDIIFIGYPHLFRVPRRAFRWLIIIIGRGAEVNHSQPLYDIYSVFDRSAVCARGADCWGRWFGLYIRSLGGGGEVATWKPDNFVRHWGFGIGDPQMNIDKRV